MGNNQIFNKEEWNQTEERQNILSSHLHVESKNEKQTNKQKPTELIDAESRLVVARKGGSG